MQITADIFIAFEAPIKSAIIPINAFPIGAVPRKTNVYTLIALPLKLSGEESCIKLFAVARKLTSPNPVRYKVKAER